jgi:hypothetical protein
VAKKDIKEAKKIWLPWPAVLFLFVLAALLRGLLKDNGMLYLYLPTWNCAAVLGFLFYVKWRLRRHAWFWTTMAAVLAIHILLIFSIPWTNNWVPALVTAGVDSLDLCLVFWILGIVEEFTGSAKDNASEALAASKHGPTKDKHCATLPTTSSPRST